MAISNVSIDLTVGIESGHLVDKTGRDGCAMIASPSSLSSATVVIGAT